MFTACLTSSLEDSLGLQVWVLARGQDVLFTKNRAAYEVLTVTDSLSQPALGILSVPVASCRRLTYPSSGSPRHQEPLCPQEGRPLPLLVSGWQIPVDSCAWNDKLASPPQGVCVAWNALCSWESR